MKFDVTQWRTIENGSRLKIQGRLRLQGSNTFAVVLEADDEQVIAAHFGPACDIRFSDETTFKVIAAEDTVVSIFLPDTISFKAEGEVYTNADRKILESGAVAEVKRELRKLALDRQQFRDETASALAQIRSAAASADFDEETGEVKTKAKATKAKLPEAEDEEANEEDDEESAKA